MITEIAEVITMQFTIIIIYTIIALIWAIGVLILTRERKP
jgi:hypothetical protein